MVFFGFPPSAIVRANTSYNLGTTFFQVGAASLTFTPRYICITCQFEFGITGADTEFLEGGGGGGGPI